MGAFCNAMKDDPVIHFSEKEGTTEVHEALWWMSCDCRFCGEGKRYCHCQPLSEGTEEVEEAPDDGSWKSDGSEFSEGWETDTEDEMEQDEGLANYAGREAKLDCQYQP